MPVSPMGALMKKIARHPRVAVSTPPTSGPADRAALAPTAQRPIARLRSRGSEKVWLSRVSEHGTSRAAPAPWSARAAMSTASDGASPQIAEATVNTENPAMNTRLAPIRSPSAPALRMSAANATV